MLAGPEGEVFSWAVEREEDVNGNVIEYLYQQPPAEFDPYGKTPSFNDLYLSRVRYNFVDGVPMVDIAFDIAGRLAGNEAWASHRDSYRPGFRLVREHFLKGITETVSDRGSVYTGHPDRVRKYVLNYHNLDPNQGRTISCLKSVQEFGETDADAYPAIAMEYSDALPEGASADTWAAAYESGTQWDGSAFPPPDANRYFLPISLGTADLGFDNALKFADYNKDGLLDFIYRFHSGTADFYGVCINNPDEASGWEHHPQTTHPYLSPLLFVWNTNEDPSFYYGNFVGDLNGDAYPDIAWRFADAATPSQWLLMNTGAGWELDPSEHSAYNLPWLLNNPRYKEEYGNRFADYNGDGLIDIVAGYEHRTDGSRDKSQAVLNTGAGWVDTASYFPPKSITYQYYYSEYGETINYPRNNGNFTGDLNGDGLTDMAWRDCSQSTGENPDRYPNFNILAMNNGSRGGLEGSSWDVYDSDYSMPPIHPYQLPRSVTWWKYLYQQDPGTRFADVNGDGLIDVIYNFAQTTTPSNYGVWLNTGNGWQAGGLAYLPSRIFASYDNVAPLSFIGDIDGDGMTDVAYAWTNSTENPANHAALCLHKGQKPNLLTRIDNGIGGAIDVEYTPSTKGWMKLYDPEPSLRVEPDANGLETNNHVPFAMQVVSRITRTGLRPNNINPANPVTPGTTSQSSTRLFRYSGGQFLDREFRGFGKVKEIDGESGNFTITQYYQDYSRRGQVKSERSYVGHRGEYRVGGDLLGEFLAPGLEHAVTDSTRTPRLVTETYYRYRVVVHEDDPVRLKTFTDISSKLELLDFPVGMTLVTPACAITRTHEYGGNYGVAGVASSIVTANETFYDVRGNLEQTIDFGQVALVNPAATFAELEQPRLDITFRADTGDPDGSVATMTRYERARLGTWMDVPVLANTYGYYTKDPASGARETQSMKLLEAKQTDYDDLNRRLREITALDGAVDPATRFVYDSYGNIETEVDPRGNPTTTVYDPIYHAFPSAGVNAAGHLEQYTVDPGTGNLLRHVDVNGRARTASYDGLGRVTARANSHGFTYITYEYGFWEESSTAAGVYLPNRVRTTAWVPTSGAPAGVWSETHHDGLNREIQELTLGQNGEDDPIRVAGEFNDRGVEWRRSHPHWVSEANEAHWGYVILENDDLTKPTGPKTWHHMGLSRPVQTSREMGATAADSETRIEYLTPLRRLVRNALQHERLEIRDAFENLTGVWEPDEAGSVGTTPAPQGRLTGYGWDALGRIEFIRRHMDRDLNNSADPVTKVTHDSAGRMTRLDDPDTGVSQYQYDANGNLIRSTDARNQSVIRQYDALNRLSELSYTDVPSGQILKHIYTYDTGIGTNLIGRLARVQSPACDTVYSYDGEGKIALKRRVIDGVPYDVALAYDASGRTTMMTYPDGMRLEHDYDAVTQALDRLTDPDTGQVWLANVDMSEFGQAKTLALGNTVSRQMEFDWIGRATQIATNSNAGALSDLRYTFDANSNIARIQELQGPSPRGTMNYVYDTLDRLTKAYGTTMSGENAGTVDAPRFQYAYDPLGRMTYNSRFLNPSYSGYTLRYEYSGNPTSDRPAHAVRGILFEKTAQPTVYAHRFEYDLAGNLLSSTDEAAALTGENVLARTYAWDALGRLKSVTTGSGVTTSFVYDHSRTRVKKTSSTGATVTYIGDVAEVTPAGMTKHIFAGPIRIATIQTDGRKLFTLTDHLRSSTLITDETGAVVQRMDYEPYGAPIQNARSANPAGVRHTYTGQENDTESGLMYYGARYYDPVVGMFTSPDTWTRRPDAPQRFEEPDLFVSADMDPQSLNRFAYCRNNPMIYVDETGEFFFIPILVAVAVGAAVGGSLAAMQAIATGQDFGDWHTWANIGIGAAVGGAAGLVGSVVGIGATAAGAGTLGSLAIGGFAGGFTGGVLGGFDSKGYQYSFGEAIGMGLVGGAIGAVVGGVGGKLGNALARGKSVGFGISATREAARKASPLAREMNKYVGTGRFKELMYEVTRQAWKSEMQTLQTRALEQWGAKVVEYTLGGLNFGTGLASSSFVKDPWELF